MKDNIKLEGDKREKIHLISYFKKEEQCVFGSAFVPSVGYQFMFLSPDTFSSLNIYLETVI